MSLSFLRVSTKSDKNRMTSHNLAVVFGPTVIHAPATIELITNQGQINIFIERLISEFYSVFPNEKLLNEDGLQSIRSDEVDEENDEVADDDADVSDVSDEGGYCCIFSSFVSVVFICLHCWAEFSCHPVTKHKIFIHLGSKKGRELKQFWNTAITVPINLCHIFVCQHGSL